MALDAVDIHNHIFFYLNLYGIIIILLGCISKTSLGWVPLFNVLPKLRMAYGQRFETQSKSLMQMTV